MAIQQLFKSLEDITQYKAKERDMTSKRTKMNSKMLKQSSVNLYVLRASLKE